jgi:hypothetical protein
MDVQRLFMLIVQPDMIAADAAHMAHLPVPPGICRGDVDTVLVNVQPDVPSARFLHDPSPCCLATT